MKVKRDIVLTKHTILSDCTFLYAYHTRMEGNTPPNLIKISFTRGKPHLYIKHNLSSITRLVTSARVCVGGGAHPLSYMPAYRMDGTFSNCMHHVMSHVIRAPSIMANECLEPFLDWSPDACVHIHYGVVAITNLAFRCR